MRCPTAASYAAIKRAVNAGHIESIDRGGGLSRYRYIITPAGQAAAAALPPHSIDAIIVRRAPAH